MAQKKKQNHFRKFEGMMTKVIVGTLALFLMMLVAAAIGIGWLKWILAVVVALVSFAGVGLLVLKQEHKRRRSRWMLASFVALLACTPVSLIVGFPAPGL